MQLYLMRHAEAVSAHAWRESDYDRPLAPSGISRLEKAIPDMKRAGFPAVHVMTSPYARARDTARLFCRDMGLPAPMEDARLSSGASHETLRRLLLDYKDPKPLLLVGHMPEVAIFASRLTTEPSLLDKGLEPADIVALQVDSLAESIGGSTLLWWRKLADWKNVKPS